jgi:membrane protease YdiL (CAAX protease family)
MTHPAARFSPSRRTLLAFVAVVPALVLAANVLETVLTQADAGPTLTYLRGLVFSAAIAALAVVLLRREGVALTDVGFDSRFAVSGIATVAGFWVVLNAAGIGFAFASGNADAVRFFYDMSLASIVGTVFAQYVVVAVAEEVAFRLYLQNKLVALIGGPAERTTRALGIVLMGLTFGLLHLPDRLLSDGLAPGTLAGSIVFLALSGIAFGVIYDLTQNAYLVVALHGTFNFWPLFVDLPALPSEFQSAFTALRFLGFVVVIWVARKWAPPAGRPANGSPAATEPPT